MEVKIKIEVDGKEMPLEEARELHRKLGEFFEKKADAKNDLLEQLQRSYQQQGISPWDKSFPAWKPLQYGVTYVDYSKTGAGTPYHKTFTAT